MDNVNFETHQVNTCIAKSAIDPCNENDLTNNNNIVHTQNNIVVKDKNNPLFSQSMNKLPEVNNIISTLVKKNSLANLKDNYGSHKKTSSQINIRLVDTGAKTPRINLNKIEIPDSTKANEREINNVKNELENKLEEKYQFNNKQNDYICSNKSSFINQPDIEMSRKISFKDKKLAESIISGLEGSSLKHSNQDNRKFSKPLFRESNDLKHRKSHSTFEDRLLNHELDNRGNL